MKITVSNVIEIENPTDEVKSWCKANLIIDNPDYFKKQRMGYSTYNTPKLIQLYEVRGDIYRLPFGCLDNLYKAYARDTDTQFINAICPIQPFNYQSGIKPYGYQEKAIIKALEVKNGIVVMPCGGGKTQTALEIVARIGEKALWLTHTQELLTQSYERAKAVFNCGGYGKITEGKVNIGSGITFATIQTMAKLDLPQYKDEWSIIIVDECQHCSGSATKVTQFYKVISNLSARYKIGLTATPHRADGLTKSMFALLGNTIHTVSREEVKDTTCPVEVQVIETGYAPQDIRSVSKADGTFDYQKFIKTMITDDTRFIRIMHEINTRKGAMIVLANRIEYLEKMAKAYEGKAVCLSGMSATKTNKLIRKKALEDLQNGEIDCIFASYTLACEGLDVPGLRYVVFATPEKDQRIVSQSVGRVARKYDDKDKGIVIDFVDAYGICKGYYTKRKKIYRELECEVVE